MNVVRSTLAALVVTTLNSGVAAAQSRIDIDANTASRGARVVVDCASRSAPRLGDVAEVVGTKYDIWATFVVRQRLIELAKPICARGTDLVEFVAAGDADGRDLRLAFADAN